jgi:hypothetical protein
MSSIPSSFERREGEIEKYHPLIEWMKLHPELWLWDRFLAYPLGSVKPCFLLLLSSSCLSESNSTAIPPFGNASHLLRILESNSMLLLR